MSGDETDLGTFVVGGDGPGRDPGGAGQAGGAGRSPLRPLPGGEAASPRPVAPVAPAGPPAGGARPSGVPAGAPSGVTSAATGRTEYGAEALIVCDNLVRIYQVDQIEVQALQGLDLLVMPGEMVAIVGASGSGKSTLLNVLSGLDVPTAGRARVAEWDLLRMTAADRLTYRRSVVGFIWQQTGRNLLPYLSATENVMMPLAFSGMGRKQRATRVSDLLEALGVGHCAKRRPAQMSGGEQQRVAIAVALANRPQVLFADEPTGELDTATGADVFAALRSANTDLGATVVIVTHDAAVSDQVQRTIAIRDGRTSSETLRRTEVDEFGESSVVAEEYAVLDRAGRVQLPREYRMALGLRDRVRLELEPDHVGVWPDGVPRRPSTPPPPPDPASAFDQHAAPARPGRHAVSADAVTGASAASAVTTSDPSAPPASRAPAAPPPAPPAPTPDLDPDDDPYAPPPGGPR